MNKTMRKAATIIAACILVAIVSMTLVACAEKEVFSVSYETNGGSAVVSEQVTKGSKIESALSIKKCSTISGWYDNAELSGEKIVYPYKVTSNITLYANWIDNHNYGEWTVKNEMKCTQDGEQERTCTICAIVENKAITAAHELEHVDAEDATCAKVGWNAYEKCTKCEYSTYEEIAKGKHEVMEVPAMEPTCHTPGWKEFEMCINCDHNTLEEITAEHTYGEWIIIKEPTSTADGSKKRVCSIELCGHEDIQIIKAGHEQVNTVNRRAYKATLEYIKNSIADKGNNK